MALHNLKKMMNADQLNIEPLTRSSGTGQTGSLTQGPSDRQHVAGVNVQSVSALDSFSIDFCNIRGFRSNFSFVEPHVLSSSPEILISSETKLSVNVSSALFKTSNYNFFLSFIKRLVYVPIVRLMFP